MNLYYFLAPIKVCSGNDHPEGLKITKHKVNSTSSTFSVNDLILTFLLFNHCCLSAGSPSLISKKNICILNALFYSYIFFINIFTYGTFTVEQSVMFVTRTKSKKDNNKQTKILYIYQVSLWF